MLRAFGESGERFVGGGRPHFLSNGLRKGEYEAVSPFTQVTWREGGSHAHFHIVL